MEDPQQILITCRNCGKTFEPNLSSRKAWKCKHCNTKNPNLKRHWRSLASLCVLGLFITGIFLFMEIGLGGFKIRTITLVIQALLLITTIIFVYKSPAPWLDFTAKLLIWIVFGLAIVFNVALPAAHHAKIDPLVAGFSIVVILYLAWLEWQSRKATT